MESSPDIIARINPAGKILFINQSVKSLLGKGAKSLSGKVLAKTKLIEPAEAGEMKKHIQQLFKSHKPVNFYQHMHAVDGKKYFYITLLPEPDLEEKKVKSALLIARDISHLHEAELNIEDKNKRLEQLNQHMDSFVHAIAHDMRAPLTNLKLVLELLDAEEDMKKRQLLINKLETSVHRIDDTLNGLIEIVDSQINVSETTKEVVFENLAKSILDHFRDELPGDATVHLDFQVKSVHHVRGYIFSIMQNLLSNAIKYRSPERPLEITIATKKNKDYILLTVQDNGIGMDFEKVKFDLFKPFKRFSTGTDGKGIGLHIIKSMIEKTGGKIKVDSAASQGTIFCVYLKEQLP